jgi:hypothetical protein
LTIILSDADIFLGILSVGVVVYDRWRGLAAGDEGLMHPSSMAGTAAAP